MATAPSPLRTAAGNLCLGYRWLELAPYGYLPTDPQRLKEELDARGLQVSGGTAFGALHRPETGAFTESPELTAGQWAGFGERVGYVHIKQMDPEILAQVAELRARYA